MYCAGVNIHLFRCCPDLQRKIERNVLVDVQLDPFASLGFEIWSFDFDGVGAGGNLAKVEPARVVNGSLESEALVHVRQSDMRR